MGNCLISGQQPARCRAPAPGTVFRLRDAAERQDRASAASRVRPLLRVSAKTSCSCCGSSILALLAVSSGREPGLPAREVLSAGQRGHGRPEDREHARRGG
jgi:hypothetical protein